MARSLNRVPLNALRSFEAVARHGSFNDAAGELGVTASAVSLQVRRLEERIGRPLFTRRHRSVSLTETGARLAPGLTETFDRMERLLSDVLGPTSASLRISAMPSFASRWLAPRIAVFAALHPEYEVRVSGDDNLLSFDRDDADLGIRYGAGPYPGLHCLRIADAAAVPVCSPAFLQRHRAALSAASGLVRLPLLHDDIGAAAPGLPTWDRWLAAAGVAGIARPRGLRFESQHMALTAAEAGQGIALGLTPLVDGALADGRLVRASTVAIASAHAFWIVCRSDRAQERKLKAIIRWIAQEMQSDGVGEDE